LGRHGIRTRAAQVDAKLEAAIRGLRLRIDMADEGTISLLARIYFDRLLAEYGSAWKPAGGGEPQDPSGDLIAQCLALIGRANVYRDHHPEVEPAGV